MKKLILSLLVLAGPITPCFASMALVDRVGAPIKTLATAPTLPKSINVIPAYGRTLQKSGNTNRVVGVLPLLNWGVLDAVAIGGTPAIGEGPSQFVDTRGLLGAGGGVSFDRILTAMFPELNGYFDGPIPGTEGKLTFAVKAGIGMVWDFTADESAVLGFVGPQINF